MGGCPATAVGGVIVARIYKGGNARKLNIFGRDQMEEFAPKPLHIDLLPPPLETSPPEVSSVDLEEFRQNLLAELRAEAQDKVEQAFKEGHRRGYEAGRKEFLDSTAQAAGLLEDAARQMAATREDFLQHLEPQVLEVVHLICARVLLREGRTGDELVVSIVRRALEKIADRQRIRLRISPRDHEALRKHRVTLLESFNGIEELEIIPDDSISPGGCIADSLLMHVDARLETLLQNVLDGLRE